MAESRIPRTPALRAAHLTIDRLFDAPALAGLNIANLKISPDGARVTYSQGSPDDKDRLDLWEYRLADQQRQLLVDARVLAPHARPLSDEEKGRRERQRTAALSGILEYVLVPSGKALIFPVEGNVYYHDLDRPGEAALVPITVGRGFATDVSVSPKGRYVGFIRDQNLIAYDLLEKREFPVTHDGAGPIKNGMAEFVAQEEMGRSSGYWWSPDENRVAFARVDESGVNLVNRLEIGAEDITTTAQRYPAAGEPNAVVQLGVADLATGTLSWIDLGGDPDYYLARVDWLPDGRTLAVQRESRDQHRLDLLFADASSGASRVVLTERSDTWIELHDELTFLERSREFIWASNRDGFTHLYLYDDAGHLVRPLTAGAWNVDDFRARAIKGVDETRRLVYFTANRQGPTTRDLYVSSLDTRSPREVRRISGAAGIHRITVAAHNHFYVDEFTSVRQPPQVGVHRMDGTLIAYLSENRLDDAHPDAPYLAENAIPEFGCLTAADGQVLHYRIFKPAGFDPGKRHPAIVDVYGGPGVQRVLDAWTGASFTQILTRAGFVVFQLDNRGTAARGTAFQAPIHGRLGETEVADQIQGARWLASQPFVDAARIGVWGWSYGGYLSLLLLCKAPDLFRAGVSGAPVTDWRLYDTHYTERYLGRPQDNSEGYAASSVLPHAGQLRGKLLVLHGMADDNVLFSHSTKLFRRLQDLGIPFDVMVYPGAKHGLTRQHDGRHAYRMILRFFDASLSGVAAAITSR
jgi:dipeptidyl-peptidase-4